MKTLKKHLGEENIEIRLVDADFPLMPYAVIVKDLDANALVTRVNCPNLAVAEKYFTKYAK